MSKNQFKNEKLKGEECNDKQEQESKNSGSNGKDIRSGREDKRYRGKNHKEFRNNRKDRETIERPRLNDPSWYYLNKQSGEACGNIPYNVFAGQKIDLGVASGITDSSNKAIPGVLAIYYSSTPGKSTSGASAVNIMSKAVYSYVRHQNSGHSNYESSDLTMYILAMSEIYTRYLECKRAYEITMTYDYANRNIPDVIAKALRIDADNLRANLAQFRYGLNILAAKISAMAVPGNFNLFKRNAVIASTILMDSTSMRGQFYVWVQTDTHKYNPTHTGGGALEAKPLGYNRTYTTLLQELSDLIDVVISDEDMNIMSGDILKAYGKENLFVLPDVSESATANFIYDENMLAQIENSCSEDPDTTNHYRTLDIYQENNLIKYNPTFINQNILSKRIFNSHKDEPNWEDTLEWSRGMTLNGCFGTELIHYYSLYMRTYDAQGNASITEYAFNTMVVPATTSDMTALTYLAAFDWHPILYFCKHNNNHQITEYTGFFGDIKKMTILSDSEIERLHDSAVMGELNGSLLSASK